MNNSGKNESQSKLLGAIHDDSVWTEILSELRLQKAVLLQARDSGIRRVFKQSGLIYKVQRTDLGEIGRFTTRDIHHECEMLSLLSSIHGVPNVVTCEVFDRFLVLVSTEVIGQPLIQRSTNEITIGFFDLPFVIWKLSTILHRISAKGVAHYDIEPWNVIYGDDGSVSLIDFDQAKVVGKLKAYYCNFLRMRNQRDQFWGSALRLLIKLLKQLFVGLIR